jgi:hypothetical protein
MGIVGNIWRDDAVPLDTPKKNWAWFCRVEDYVPFVVPVPAKINETFFETIEQNMWRNGVRKLSEEVFARITAAAGLSPTTQEELTPTLPELPEIPALVIREVDSGLMVPTSSGVNDGADVQAGAQARRSRNAKIAGDRAEQIVLRFIGESVMGARDIRHVAADGEKPGWDIQYLDADGNLNAVEVKGSSASAFPNFELTQGEFNAARRLGRRYGVYLVADCFSRNPKVQRIQDPVALLGQRSLEAHPILWRISQTGLA